MEQEVGYVAYCEKQASSSKVARLDLTDNADSMNSNYSVNYSRLKQIQTPRGCKSACWRLLELQALQAMDATGCFVFSNQSPNIGGMFRCGLVCLNAAENSMEEVLGSEGQRFELAAGACRAAAYSGHDMLLCSMIYLASRQA